MHCQANYLSQTTLAQLRSLGLTVESARDVSGSQHVSAGQVVTTPQSGGAGSTNQQTSNSNKLGENGWNPFISNRGTLTLEPEAVAKMHLY